MMNKLTEGVEWFWYDPGYAIGINIALGDSTVMLRLWYEDVIRCLYDLNDHHGDRQGPTMWWDYSTIEVGDLNDEDDLLPSTYRLGGKIVNEVPMCIYCGTDRFAIHIPHSTGEVIHNLLATVQDDMKSRKVG